MKSDRNPTLKKQSFSLQFLALKDEFILKSTAGTGLLCTKYLAVD